MSPGRDFGPNEENYDAGVDDNCGKLLKYYVAAL